MKKVYRTIKASEVYEEVIRKSRFICYLKRVYTEEDALIYIETIKKKHYKATHHCSAYTIGEQNDVQRAHDDGEPSGTAGIPMLEGLKKNDVKNVVAVITRYYGGIKLGAGGLIRAYGGVLSNALAKARLVEVKPMNQIDLTVPYPLSGKIENELRQSDHFLTDTRYTDQVTFVCLVAPHHTESFCNHYTNLSNGQANFTIQKEVLIEVPLSD